MDFMHVGINGLPMHKPVCPIKVSVMRQYKKHYRENEVGNRVVAEVQIHLRVAHLAECKGDSGHQRENSNRQERVSYLAKDMFVIGVLLLNLKTEPIAFLPYIKNKKQGTGKGKIAQ